ncbi:uncharacterized protein I303_106592 [Kwoniella dejecticola CBS 10117]|uniref:Serine/threonine-protein kinase Tel1 n=1 Tax=Kwoniella dejecticola CBS 10117 TaxID=1296121 RepID=A0AAJ8KUH9_9TREE
MNTVRGLENALQQTQSKVIKDRVEGVRKVRELFSNRQNLNAFSDVASREGGSAWISFYECLFNTVAKERAYVVKPAAKGGTTADKRLADAISLVRWMAERTVHLISKKPFLTIFNNMTKSLVSGDRIFPPAALDYAKALRTLLIYPPHLESLDTTSWKILMNICWCAVLGDKVTIDPSWGGEDSVADLEEEMEVDEFELAEAGTTSWNSAKVGMTQFNVELVSLIPILLSSSSAPIVPPIPQKAAPGLSVDRSGYSILMKINRFFNQYSTETSVHLAILRSLNLLFAEFELNCRDDFLTSGLKLFPQLVSLWTTKNKVLREQVVIAIRTLLPFITHKTLVDANDASDVRSNIETLMEGLYKETIDRRGVEPLELNHLRLSPTKAGNGVFEKRGIGAGYGFTNEHAMIWAILELYAEAAVYLHESQSWSHPSTPSRNGGPSKRRRVENSINSLIFGMRSGNVKNRLLALQVMTFICDQDLRILHDEAQAEIRRTMIDLLDEDDESLQAWAFIGLSVLAQISHEQGQQADIGHDNLLESPSSRSSAKASAEDDWKKVWGHAIRKASIAGTCRAACHAAHTLLRLDKLDSALFVKDIYTFLRNVDVQGPIFAYDSVCAFLALALNIAKSDVRLYSLELESKVLNWLEKTGLMEGPRGNSRMEQQTPADVLALLASISRYKHYPLMELSTEEVLPDAAIVDRVLEEANTKPIRDFLLYGNLPAGKSNGVEAHQQEGQTLRTSASTESLNYLEGRARRISSFLTSTLHAQSSGWETAKEGAIAPEKARRSLDLMVITLSFQATVQLNGNIPDSHCINSAVELLACTRTSLLSNSLSIPSQHLIWRGFEPLVHSPVTNETDWPLLVQPDSESGIRRDLLPTYHYDTSLDNDAGPMTGSVGSAPPAAMGPSQSFAIPSQIPLSGSATLPPTAVKPVSQALTRLSASQTLTQQIWLLSTVSAAFKDVFSLCLQVMTNRHSPSNNNGSVTQVAEHIDDDDFGEIRNAETDAMPLSKEAIECQRTSASLLSTVMAVRLKGYMLISNLQRPYKDPQMINTVLSTEGSRFIELARVMCLAVRSNWLKLSFDATEMIIDMMEDMLRSYAFARNTALLGLIIDFVKCSMPVWLGPDGLRGDLGERGMQLVCYCADRILKGTISSWRVKISVLSFMDEFLHYDLAREIWIKSIEDFVDINAEQDQDDYEPLGYLAASLLDLDARVRLRAATSASLAYYRPILPSKEHRDFYFRTLGKQPGDDKHFDSFISHTLWKLNCCIATAQQRSAAVFHLYEIPGVTSAYNGHLQLGLEAVASRLGLSSISDLYLPYAIIIIRSQLIEGQLAMRVPHKLYGFPTRKAYSQACLQRVGPFMLAEGHIDFYNSACEAANMDASLAIEQAFPSTAAIAFAQAFTTEAKQAAKEAMDKLGSLPGIDSKRILNKWLEDSVDTIAAHLWELLDLQLTTEGMADVLNEMTGDHAAGLLWSELMTNDSSSDETTAIDPYASARNIVAAYQYLKSQYPTLATLKMVFSAVIRLTGKINGIFLVSEQRRYLKALSLLVVLHQEAFQSANILQVFLQELLAILRQPDICGIVISMVGWGFRQIEVYKSPIPNLTDLFVQLGLARTALSVSEGEEVGAGLENWIIESAQQWSTSTTTRTAFEAALALWPASLRMKLAESYTPLFTDLGTLSERPSVKNAGELCKQYLTIMKTSTKPEAVTTFTQSLFWHLKGKTFDGADMEGINAFLDILQLADGQIRLPSLDSMAVFSSYSTNYLNISTSKQEKEPEIALRASIVQEVSKLIDDDNHRTRAIAYEALQGMIPRIRELLNGTILPPDLKARLSVLTPISFSSTHSESKALDAGINSSGWLKLCRSSARWSKELVKVLCEVVATDDDFYTSLQPLLSSDGISLQHLLPHIVQATLTCGASQNPEITLTRVRLFSEHFTGVIQYPAASLDVIHTIIDTILHLRHFQPNYRNGELGYNAWLEVDYVLLSQAAVRIGAYATALMFLELARDQDGGIQEGDGRVQKIMYGIYSNVEDPDGFYGIENHDVRDALLRRLEHEGLSQRAFAWNGALIETSPSNGRSNPFLPALHNLHTFGFNRLASSMTSHAQQEGSAAEEDPFFYELAWRTGGWDLPMSDAMSKTPQGSLYSALRAVHRERDREAALRCVNSSIKVEMERLSGLGMERMAQIKKTTVNLLCLREAAHWLDGGFQAEIEKAHGDVGGFGVMSKAFEFADAERLTAVHLSLLRSGRQREDKDVIGDMLSPKAELLASLEKKSYLRLAELAKEDDNIQASVNAITAVQQLEMGKTPSDEAQDAFSHVLWSQHEHGLAIQHAQDLTEEVKIRKPADPGRLAVLYGRIAHWTDLAKLKAASDIRQTFEMAYGIAAKVKVPNEDLARICHEYASFADNHCSNLSKSSELGRLKSYQERKMQDSDVSSTLKSSRRESTSRSSKAGLEAEEDERTIQALEKERLSYITLALRMYAKALTFSDTYDDSITQLVSLWLQHDDQEEVNKSFAVYLKLIPSHKFVFLGPQLAARLYRPTVPTSFNQNLNGLLLRMSQDHPFHILYQVITLAHGVTPPTSAKRKSTAAENLGRGPAALEILSSLAAMASDKLPNRAAQQMKVFVEASVAWSRYKENSQLTDSLEGHARKPKAGSSHSLPTNSPLRNLSLRIPVATYSLPLDLSCQYQDIPTFHRYRTRYMIAGGVHRPRIMQCLDSDGKQHQQLFKAEDEVRQDAVMEQVFTMTNDLLSRDRQAKVRNLKFRTYNVVPLPERTGIIEFVEGTRGIGDWLKPAHQKYRNGLDIPTSEFQSKMAAIQDRDYKSAELPKKYMECMKKFKPVLRHFFVEKHKDPMAWFTMRLNYSRSVAVTSIVGWMVGLGDRHCSNILIDQSTGELVHIDFGIVFEDGRKLRIPEKVPFRLTNDLVDGLGISGIEGTFKRCSEHTLRVLRDSSSLILTILEVFKNDPLYAWAGDPDKLQRAQGGKNANANANINAITEMMIQDANVKEKADRVLSKIKSKLGSELSIEYTVNMLIQEARDVEHLSRIYHGWAPWF